MIKSINSNKLKSAVVFIFLFLTVSLNAQEQTVNQFNSWWYYSGTYKMNNKWTGNLLYSWSRHNFVRDWQISKLGISANRSLSNNFGIGGSYEWAIIFPYGELPVPEKRREHRFLERVYFRDKINKIAVGSTFEVEQYFSNSDFLHRVRVRIGFKFPLITTKEGQQVLGMSFFEQAFIDIENGAPSFGQNRYYGGFDIRINKSFTLALGYLNQYIIIRPQLIENDHTLMVGIFHNVDLSKLFEIKNK